MFELTPEGVHVTESSFLSSRKYQVPFENIQDETVELSISSKWSFWLSFGFIGLALFIGVDTYVGNEGDYGASIFYGVIGLITGFRFIRSRETFVLYPGHEPPLAFFKDKPSSQELDRFSHQLKTSKLEYLRQNYMSVGDVTTTVDELQKLAWLKEHGAITEEEFVRVKEDLIGTRPPKDFGFR